MVMVTIVKYDCHDGIERWDVDPEHNCHVHVGPHCGVTSQDGFYCTLREGHSEEYHLALGGTYVYQEWLEISELEYAAGIAAGVYTGKERVVRTNT